MELHRVLVGRVHLTLPKEEIPGSFFPIGRRVKSFRFLQSFQHPSGLIEPTGLAGNWAFTAQGIALL